MAPKKKILVVDDDLKHTQIIQDLLIFEGHDVSVARDGREALKIIESEGVDLVITDYEMPGMDGFELLKKVSRGYPDLPVIMLTGQYREDMSKAIATLKEGAYDYLTKPVDLSSLRRAVITALHVGQTKKDSRELMDALAKAHSELNRKNEKLEELTHINNDFLNILSQDLEAPLTILTASCKMLLKQDLGPLPDEQRERIARIAHQGDKILGIVNDLIDVARIDTEQIELSQVEVELHPLLEKCRQNLQPTASNRNITIDLQPPGGLKPIFADEGRMKQALFNLLHQVILFSDRNHTIRVGIVPRPQAQRVEISFQGTTLPAAKIQKVLSGEEEVPEIEKQTLYRLNLSRELIELHQGKIWIENGVERETLLCLEIPIVFVR